MHPLWAHSFPSSPSESGCLREHKTTRHQPPLPVKFRNAGRLLLQPWHCPHCMPRQVPSQWRFPLCFRQPAQPPWDKDALKTAQEHVPSGIQDRMEWPESTDAPGRCADFVLKPCGTDMDCLHSEIPCHRCAADNHRVLPLYSSLPQNFRNRADEPFRHWWRARNSEARCQPVLLCHQDGLLPSPRRQSESCHWFWAK